MKIKLILGTLLISCGLARASLIDLTPGGFSLTDPFPIVVQQFFGQFGHGLTNVAGANIDFQGNVHWSPFTIFGPNEFSLNPNGPNATTGWDISGTGYRLNFIFVENGDNLTANLYRVGGGTRFVGNGGLTIDGIGDITGVTYSGRNFLQNGVPDTGYTLLLFGGVLIAGWLLKHVLGHTLFVKPAS